MVVDSAALYRDVASVLCTMGSTGKRIVEEVTLPEGSERLLVNDLLEHPPSLSLSSKLSGSGYSSPYAFYHDLKLATARLVLETEVGTSQYNELRDLFSSSVDLLLREAIRITKLHPSEPLEIGDSFLVHIRQGLSDIFTDAQEYYGEAYYLIAQNGPLFTTPTGKSIVDSRPSKVGGPIHTTKLLPLVAQAPSQLLGYSVLPPDPRTAPNPTTLPTDILERFVPLNRTTLSASKWIEGDQYSSFAPTNDSSDALASSGDTAALWIERASTSAFNKEVSAEPASESQNSSQLNSPEQSATPTPTPGSAVSEAALSSVSNSQPSGPSSQWQSSHSSPMNTVSHPPIPPMPPLPSSMLNSESAVSATPTVGAVPSHSTPAGPAFASSSTMPQPPANLQLGSRGMVDMVEELLNGNRQQIQQLPAGSIGSRPSPHSLPPHLHHQMLQAQGSTGMPHQLTQQLPPPPRSLVERLPPPENVDIDVESLLEWTPASFIDDDEIDAAVGGSEKQLVARLLLELQCIQRERLAMTGETGVPCDRERKIASKIENILTRLVGSAPGPSEASALKVSTMIPVILKNYAGTLPSGETPKPPPPPSQAPGSGASGRLASLNRGPTAPQSHAGPGRPRIRR